MKTTFDQERHIAPLRNSLLQKGYAIRLPVAGYSMFPQMRPDDRIHVAPKAGQQPRAGRIVVFEQRGQLVAHRIMRRTAQGTIICKGDSNLHTDQPFSPAQIQGIATGFYRSQRYHAFGLLGRRVYLALSHLRYPLFMLKLAYLKYKALKRKIRNYGL